MSFSLSEDHEAFRKVVRDFAEKALAPNIERWEREVGGLPTEAVNGMADLGLFGLTASEEYGGAGADLTTLCVAIEEIGRVDQSLGITLEAAVGLGINPIATYGTPEQKAQWLPDLVAGRALAGFGLTEPEAGSDAGGTRTKAVLENSEHGAEWVVDGAKAFITNSGHELTSVVTVTARTGTNADGTAELSAIMVPTGTPGFTAEPAYRKLGWHLSDTHPLSYDGARVPEANLLGARGRGFAQFLNTLDDGRIAIAALAVGLSQACLDHSVSYALERKAFGQPIGKKQGLAFQIADLQVAVEASRLLTYKAAWLKDSGASVKAVKQAASIAKLYATEAAVSATRTATQVYGGYGFMEEYPIARFYRDAKVLEIGEGTSEVQRILISRGLGLPVE
jgi:butyryl-CoA dehydrogenase